MGKPLSLQIRYILQGYKEAGLDAKRALDCLNKYHPEVQPSIQTIHNIFKQIDDTGNPENKLKGNVGRKPLLSEQQKNQIVEMFTNEPTQTLRKAQQSQKVIEQPISHVTISKTLKESGLKAFKKPSMIILNDQQKKARMKFAYERRGWTLKWKTILFSDESILFADLIGNQYVWATSRSEIDNKDCFDKIKYPKKIHVFGIISYEKPLQLLRVKGNLNSQIYCSLLNESFTNIGWEAVRSHTFQQDQATCHTSRYTIDWLKSNKIETLDWPAKSADLSPIECVWAILKDELCKTKQNIENEDELFKIAEHLFYNNKRIQQTIKNFYTSLPNQKKEVVRKKGDFLS
ncbi:hypothetical protein ABPG72_005313 [Tetrahymena utriculariae]